MRERLADYQYMLKLAQLAAEKDSGDQQSIINQRLAKLELGQREHNELFPISDWRSYRRRMTEAIDSLRN